MLLRRPLRRVKFAQRRLRVFPMGAGGMPPASGRAPPAKRRRGARGNRLPHAEAHLLQLLLQDAAGGHEDRRHGARAARLPGRHDGAALLLPGQHVHRVREARLRPHLGTGEVPPEPCPQDAEQGRCCSGPLMRAGAACRRGRALPPAPGARSPRGDAAGPPSRLRGRAGEFLDDGGQLGGSCAPAASPLLCLCSGGRANECALALRGAGWVAQWPAHTRMMTQGWAGAVGMAAWRAPARRRAHSMWAQRLLAQAWGWCTRRRCGFFNAATRNVMLPPHSTPRGYAEPPARAQEPPAHVLPPILH